MVSDETGGRVCPHRLVVNYLVARGHRDGAKGTDDLASARPGAETLDLDSLPTGSIRIQLQGLPSHISNSNS